MTGEQLGAAIAALLDAGVHDAWVTPAVMKKGRPAHVLHALCDPAQTAVVRDVVARTTGTFGMRAVGGERWPAARQMAEVAVGDETIRMKVGDGRAKPEFDDVVRAAGRTGLPAREIASRAEEAWRHGGGGHGSGTGGPP
ncbi:MAG TPA: nickel insertion protein [Acidimicrobiales bacterium]